MLSVRPILELLHNSTSAILVEMFAMTSVAVSLIGENPVQNIYSAKSASPESFLITL
jgi:hypothetical protein